MGTYANHADTIEESFVKETCPEELAGLLKVLAENDYDLDRLASCVTDGGDIEGELSMDFGDDYDIVKAILDAFHELCMTFQDKTQGLELNLRYHTKEDRGDEVDGKFWQVEGVYVLSEAGKNHIKKVTRKFWTNWG
jgi:hypothetical protein